MNDIINMTPERYDILMKALSEGLGVGAIARRLECQEHVALKYLHKEFGSVRAALIEAMPPSRMKKAKELRDKGFYNVEVALRLGIEKKYAVQYMARVGFPKDQYKSGPMPFTHTEQKEITAYAKENGVHAATLKYQTTRRRVAVEIMHKNPSKVYGKKAKGTPDEQFARAMRGRKFEDYPASINAYEPEMRNPFG